MDRETAKQDLKSREPDFLQRAPQKVNGHISYVCPKCGNGSGSSGTGLALDPHAKTKRYKCFVCELNEDVIGLWKLSKGVTDNAEAFKGLYQYYGITVDGQKQDKTGQDTHTHNSIHTDTYTQEHTQVENKSADKMDYIKECAGRVGQTDYFRSRGLSDELVTKLMLGYDPSYYDGQTKTRWRAVVIPTGTDSYVVRNADPDAEKDNRYRKHGSSKLYLSSHLESAQSPIFITEGELDALSIIEAGGEAVGLGSTSNKKKLLEAVKAKAPAQPLVLALDNDEDGRKTEDELAEALASMGIPFYRLNPYGEAKDANQALNTSREALTDEIRRAETMKEEALKEEAERAKREQEDAYKQTSVAHKLQGFLNSVRDSKDAPFYPTGFSKLDNVLEGGLYEGLYTVGAISSLGKTTLVLQIADQLAEAGHDVLIFSLEMAEHRLMARSISRLTLLDVLQNDGRIQDAKTSRGISTGCRYEKYSKTELEIITRATKAYASYAEHLYIHYVLGGIGTDDIRNAIKEHISITGRKPVVVVDYLQILAPADIKATDKQNTDKNVLELVKMANDYHIPILAISSVNRASYNNKASLDMLKESGNIEFDSDVILGLQLKGVGTQNFDVDVAKSKNPREVEMVILKNREGATGGTVEFEYYPMFNYFKEV